MSLSSKVLAGLLLGIMLGIVFGERIAFVGGLGRGFILLLQMAVLPYVAVSLVAGLGGLGPRGWGSLLRYAGGFLVLIWTVTLMIVACAPLAFPDWPAASFFSATLVADRQAFDFLDLYIPANPFRSLADGVVPAVVVFSLAFGLALMGSERKGPLLDALLAVQDALSRLSGVVVRLAPYGIFAIAAEAAGTLEPQDLAGLQVYVVAYVVLSLVLTFWVLPALVAAVTPLAYREVLAGARDALLTAFATGSLFLVLPIVADRARALLTERGASEEAMRQVDVVVPMAFTLAGAGKLLGLVFVLYAGWQTGYPLSLSEYPFFAATGIFSSFAGSAVSLPFLLELFHVPSDTFQLYLVVDSVIGNRFSALAGTAHTFALALLAGCGAAAWMRIEPQRLVAWGLATLLAATAALGIVRVCFQLLDNPYTGYRTFIQRSFLLPTARWSDRDELPEPPLYDTADALARVRSRGVLRVGYAPNRLPFAFRNEAGQLVGFDVEMAHALARDLGVRVEFFRTNADRFPSLLDSGRIDVVMTGLAITPERLERMRFSSTVLQETLAFVVRDYHRKEFSNRDSVRALPGLHLAVPDRGYYAAKIREYLPEAQISIVESPRAFFRAEEGSFDALVFAAEAGSAWTLIYPEFTVAVPHPDVLRVPVGYATARDDDRMANLIDSWILLKRNDRTIERLFAYWFEGKDPPGHRPRWSLARDVFGWGTTEEESPNAPEPSATPKSKPAPSREPPRRAREAATPETLQPEAGTSTPEAQPEADDTEPGELPQEP